LQERIDGFLMAAEDDMPPDSAPDMGGEDDEPKSEGEEAAHDLREALNGDDDADLWAALEHCFEVLRLKKEDEGPGMAGEKAPGAPAGILAILAKKRKAG
jgi:hypothetical protein